MESFQRFAGQKTKIAQAKAMRESVELITAQAEKDVQTLVKKQYTEIEKAT